MKISVIYLCVSRGRLSEQLAARFATSYARFPAGIEHQLVIACNGGRLPKRIEQVLTGIGAIFYPRPNEGADLGAYKDLAFKTDADLMLCLGESVYFHRPGWLARLAEAFSQNGPGMYGTLSSTLVRLHLNTTAFAVSPRLLLAWPKSVMLRRERHQFEHGEQPFWRWIFQGGWPVKLVTWDEVLDPPAWRRPPNILWRGDQSNCLLWCNHTDRYLLSNAEQKERWAAGADGRLLQRQPEFQTA